MMIKIEFDENETEKLIQERLHKIQPRFDALVMRDSNFYCPHDTGTLQKSVLTSSQPGSGVLSWVTPYAKAQYYGHPHKSHQHNPNAAGKWFEAAKAHRMKIWEKLVNDWYRTAR